MLGSYERVVRPAATLRVCCQSLRLPSQAGVVSHLICSPKLERRYSRFGNVMQGAETPERDTCSQNANDKAPQMPRKLLTTFSVYCISGGTIVVLIDR